MMNSPAVLPEFASVVLEKSREALLRHQISIKSKKNSAGLSWFG